MRRVAKRAALLVFLATVGLDRLRARLGGRAPFLLAGDCRRCAACCEAPAIRVGWLTWHLPTLRRAFLWWQRRVNGFELAGSDRRDRVLSFRCTHFDRTTRLCDSYESRPGMCRDYPRVHLYEARPELLPGCGYRPLARDAKRLLVVLDAQPMTDARRARLKRDLFLE